jgi:O-antigen ligase
MPRTLALLCVAGFSAFLLKWYDAKARPKVSPALWIPSIWMLISASRPLARWFSYGEDAESSLDQAVLGGLFLCGLIVLTRRRMRWATLLRENVWLVLLLLYMLISVLWSDLPGTAFKRWIRELGALIMALVVLTDRAPRQAMLSVLRRVVYILIPLSLVLIKYFPDLGVAYGRWSGGLMWTGVTLQKNGLGRLCLIAMFFLIWTLTRRQLGRDVAVNKYQTWAEVLLLLMTLWLLKGPTIQAYSATAVTSLAVGLITFGGLFAIKRMRQYHWSYGLLVVLVVAILNGFAMPIIKGRAQAANEAAGANSAMGRDASFTGRTDVWRGLLPDLESNLLLGVGFGSFWTPENRVMHDIGEAHNGYLDLSLELGLVGFVLLSMFLLSLCAKAIRALVYDFDWASFVICSVLMVAIHNTTESSLNSFGSPLTALLIFLAISFRAALQFPVKQVRPGGARTAGASESRPNSEFGPLPSVPCSS